jgi:pimeloyl-ACP methyl ester carboxylesterase
MKCVLRMDKKGAYTMQCQLDNLTVYYEDYGEGRPLIMLHGRPLDHRHMVAEMEPLFQKRPGWRRLYLDLPGMGRTLGPDWITHQDQVLDVVTDFIDRVIPGQRFTIAGLSYGGYLARGLLYRRGDQIDGVLMTVPAVIMDQARRIFPDFVIVREDPALLAELDPDTRQSIQNMAVVQSRAVVDSWQAVILPAVRAADHAFIERTDQARSFSFEAELDGVTFDKPTLIITGRQDNVCGYQQAWEMLANFPRATFAVLDRAGHGLTMEQPQLFRALAAEWLDRVEENTGS